jgi:hypothetical protein
MQGIEGLVLRPVEADEGDVVPALCQHPGEIGHDALGSTAGKGKGLDDEEQSHWPARPSSRS